ncbi:MAG: apolipoprotein N-acyltransferase [Saprospiraceae bacterium]|nr:apolipoprotein N-acyltransferase [Saprospiraceae bacterium]
MNQKKIIFPLIAVVAVFIFSCWRMAELPLWGHYPLFLFLSGWFSVILLFAIFRKRNIVYWKNLALVSVSSILLLLSFPPISCTPLIFLSFIPILYYLDSGLKKQKTSWFLIYHSFVLWNILCTWWVANTALIPGIVAIWLNSLFMLIPVWLSIKTSNYFPKLAWWPLVFYWVAYEQLHHQWEMSWPWLSLGNAWSGFSSWVQWYEYTGTFGGSFWTLVINLLIYNFIKKYFELENQNFGQWIRDKKFHLSMILVSIFIPVATSFFIKSKVQDSNLKVKVAIVQPNFEPHYQKFEVSESDQFDRFDSLSRAIVDRETRYLIFPETSFGEAGAVLRSNILARDPRIEHWKKFLDSFPKLALVTGVTSIHELALHENPTKFSRKFSRTDPPRYFEVENAAIQITSSNEDIPHYRKSRLVPGAELFPYRKWLPFLKPLVDKLGGSIEGLATQKDREVFINENYKIAPVICYESIYGDYIRGYALNGAQAIFVMTNDGWWDDTPGYLQHREFARLRAIEFRKPVMRSANTGSSCFINSKGEISQATAYGIPAVISQEVHFSDQLTFFAKYGDLIGRICKYVSFLFIVVMLIFRISKSKN